MAQDRQVVGDEEIGEPEALAQSLQQVTTCAWIESRAPDMPSRRR